MLVYQKNRFLRIELFIHILSGLFATRKIPKKILSKATVEKGHQRTYQCLFLQQQLLQYNPPWTLFSQKDTNCTPRSYTKDGTKTNTDIIIERMLFNLPI